MSEPELEKDRPAQPASDSLLLHIVDEMPFRVVCAVTFVAFFFVWGGVNNVLKLFVSAPLSQETNYGLLAGALAAVATPVILWRIKRRPR